MSESPGEGRAAGWAQFMQSPWEQQVGYSRKLFKGRFLTQEQGKVEKRQAMEQSIWQGLRDYFLQSSGLAVVLLHPPSFFLALPQMKKFPGGHCPASIPEPLTVSSGLQCQKLLLVGAWLIPACCMQTKSMWYPYSPRPLAKSPSSIWRQFLNLFSWDWIHPVP